MIDAKLLESASKRLKGSDYWEGDPDEGYEPYCQWGDGENGMNKIIYATSDECPEECFDLLDRMEEAGHSILLRSMTDGYVADTMHPGVMHQVAGDTRTEAVLRLFVAVMPEVVE